MTVSITTRIAPEPDEFVEWLRRTRRQQGIAASREALIGALRRHPDDALITELFAWHHEDWWQPLHFGGIELVRRTAEQFDFLWSLIVDQAFASLLKQIPESITPRDLLESLTADENSLIPEHHAVHWVIQRDRVPIGVAMLVNINFRHRVAEVILGVLPGHDRSFAVGDAFCACLMFAFNCLGMRKVQARALLRNQRAIAIQQRLGLTQEAIMREEIWTESAQRYDDLVQFSLLRDEFQNHRVLQRIARRRHDPRLDQLREWPRRPLDRVRT